jgi:hypothetical protein
MGAPDLSNWLWPDVSQQRQPQGTVSVNPQIFPRCVRAIIGTFQYPGAVPVGLPSILTPSGIGYTNTGSAALGVSIGANSLVTSNGAGTGDFTIVLVTNAPPSSSAVPTIYCGGNGLYFGLYANADTSVSTSSGAVTLSNFNGSGISLSGILDGNTHTIIFSNVGGTITGYVDGVVKSSIAWSAPTWASGSQEYLGGYSGGGGNGMAGFGAQLFATANRGLSQAEGIALSANPWQIFQPPKLGIYMPATSGGVTGTAASTQAPNGSAASDAVTVSGTAASAQAPNVSSGAGSVFVSASGASTQQVNVSAASGSVVVSAIGASTQAVNVSSASGSVAVSGTAASSQAANVSAASGSVAVSGSAASTQAVNVSNESASAIVSGAAASTQAANTSSASGSLQVAGSSASTQQPNVSASSDSLTVSGTASSTQASNTSNAGGNVGNVVAGSGASTQALNTSAASGSVSLTGSGVSTQNANVSAETGAVALSGTSASAQHVSTSTASGSLTVSGSAASAQSPNVSVASGTVSSPVISGSGASVQAVNVSTGLGGIKFSGASASIQQPNYSIASGFTGFPITGAGASTQQSNCSIASGVIGAASYPVSPGFYLKAPYRNFYTKQAARGFYCFAPARTFYIRAMLNTIPSLNQLDPRETAVLTFDGTALLNGATFTGTPTVTATTVTGTDSPPSLVLTDVIVNSEAISVGGNTIQPGCAVQMIASGGDFNSQYLIAVVCDTTNAENVWAMKAFLPMAPQ